MGSRETGRGRGKRDLGKSRWGLDTYEGVVILYQFGRKCEEA